MERPNDSDNQLIQVLTYLLSNNKKPRGVEPPENYRAGGFHLIELEDTIGDRYEVFEKLGYGEYSTVWLCLDKAYQGTRWCAVKVMSASQSYEEYTELKFMRRFGRPDLLRLHIQLTHLDNISRKRMRELFGPSEKRYTYPANLPGPTRAPMYLTKRGSIRIRSTKKIASIDSGVHFEAADPPNYNLDSWALACTIFEVRTGHAMFRGGHDLTMVRSLEQRLGPLPEPYNSVCKKRMLEFPSMVKVKGAKGTGEPVFVPTIEGEPVSGSTAVLREAVRTMLSGTGSMDAAALQRRSRTARAPLRLGINCAEVRSSTIVMLSFYFLYLLLSFYVTKST